jgi:hypothetical protein
MPLTPEEMDRKLDEHFRFEATDNIEGVLSTLAPDAVHDIVGYPTGPTRGRDAARGFYNQLFADLSESSARTIKRLYGENFLIDETLWTGRAPAGRSGLKDAIDRWSSGCFTCWSSPKAARSPASRFGWTWRQSSSNFPRTSNPSLQRRLRYGH